MNKLAKKGIISGSSFNIILFLTLFVWWIYIFIGKTTDAPINHIFGLVYGGFSLWGSYWAFSTASLWGGRKSTMGRAILALAIGLLLQGFGQYSFWVYNYILKVAVPYPSISDLGYFGTIPFYIYAAIQFAQASGAGFSLKLFKNRLYAVVIPAVMLAISYLLFLKDYTFDTNEILTTFFDFGYPLGQAIYISIAILAYSLSQKMLGGIMKIRIMIIVAAFFSQYLADYIFIYFSDLYFPASFIDCFYLFAYFMMTVAVLQLRSVAHQISKPSQDNDS